MSFNTLICKCRLTIGIYTGIVAITLWNIFTDKCRPIRRAVIVVIILLHALITMGIAVQWSFICSAFIENGQSFWTIFSKLNGVNEAAYLGMGITSTMSTILADSYIIWCCWMVWGCRWLIALLPIISLISAVVAKSMEMYHEYFSASGSVFMMLYMTFILATTLWCTLFIIFRILSVTGVRRSAGLSAFRRFIEVLVESYALYSIALILALAFHDSEFFYMDGIAAIAKGVAPTLLVGRAAAGHTHPTEEHDENSLVSTIRFQTPSRSSRPSQSFTSSFQESTLQNAVLEVDVEAQTQQSHELFVSVVN
ncbi:hypothetical protein EDD85DRAFT_131087 [Armillaria nabsnona]|nr:hypothetical protein EDD85DRAFT_131087 [Armillaria nabsnona]